MSSQSKPLVLVTGASGFLGYHTVYELLQQGYSVRGAARGKKVELLRQALASYKSFEAVEIADVSSGDFSEVMKGVGAVIHTAAPLSGRADPETAFKSAIEGSLHTLREAHKAGVKQFVLTSSMASFNPQGPYGPNDFSVITREQALNGTPFEVYMGQKTFADKGVVEYADAHPEIDVTILCPSFIFGPLSPGFETFAPTPDDWTALSTNRHIYNLVKPDTTVFVGFPGFINIHDVAKAHVVALTAPPTSQVGRKRFPVIHPEVNSYKEAIEIIKRNRPELASRTVDIDKAPSWPAVQFTGLVGPQELLEKALNLKSKEFISWEKTILDTIDCLLALEKSWKEKGINV